MKASKTFHGRIVYLPADVPKESIISRELNEGGAPAWVFANPVLVLYSSTANGFVRVVPVVSLSEEERSKAIQTAGTETWPKYVLISQAWTAQEREFQKFDEDFQNFIQVDITQESLRIGKKMWIRTDQAFFVEARYLLKYPVSPPQPRKALPNPPIHVTHADLVALQNLDLKWTGHPVCIGPQIDNSTPRVQQQAVAIGSIYRLPLASNNPALRQIQNYSFYEKPFGKPFLVTHITYARRSDMPSSSPADYQPVRVSGYALTNFHHGAIDTSFGRTDRKTLWIRSQYLPVEGPNAVMHDNLPVVQLGPGSARFQGSWYVNARRKLELYVGELTEWSGEGCPQIYLAAATVVMVEEHNRRLHQERTYRLNEVDHNDAVHTTESATVLHSDDRAEILDHSAPKSRTPLGYPARDAVKTHVQTWGAVADQVNSTPTHGAHLSQRERRSVLWNKWYM